MAELLAVKKRTVYKTIKTHYIRDLVDLLHSIESLLGAEATRDHPLVRRRKCRSYLDDQPFAEYYLIGTFLSFGSTAFLAGVFSLVKSV